jgi:hypothetical protein
MLAFKLQQYQTVNPDMKTNRLILFAAALGVAGFSQAQTQDAVKGLKWNENTTKLDLVSVNPADPTVIQTETAIVLSADKKYMPNTLTHIKEHNAIYFFTQSHSAMVRGFTQSQQLEVANAETGKILRSLPITSTTMMAPFIVTVKNQLGFIAAEPKHNAYGNNDDNIALVLFDMNSGEMAHRIELPSLSMSATATPFVGTASTRSPNGFNMVETEVSISSPCFIPTLNTMVFAAKDITGVNRLFRIDLQTGKLISKLSVGVDVLDMTFDAEKGLLHALYVSESKGIRTLNLGEMSLSGNLLEHSTQIRVLEQGEEVIADGELEFDVDAALLTVVKTHDDKQIFYTYDLELNLVSQKERSTISGNIDVEFSTPVVSPSRVDFEDMVKLYPNPATDVLTIETEQLTKVKRITVFDNVGQEVKDVDVQSNELLNSIDISALKPGIYLVEIQSTGVTTLTKKLVVQ